MAAHIFPRYVGATIAVGGGRRTPRRTACCVLSNFFLFLDAEPRAELRVAFSHIFSVVYQGSAAPYPSSQA